MSRRQKEKPGGVLMPTGDDGTTFCYGYDTNAEIVGFFVRCEKHPYYRALRAPRADCKTCRTMYEGKLKKVKISFSP